MTGVFIQVKGSEGKIYTQVDEEDAKLLTHYTYYYNPDNGYVFRRGLRNKTIYLHQDIMRRKMENMMIDHISRNKLDNRRSQLCFATCQQNCMNSPPRKGRLFKGIYETRSGKWIAKLQNRYLGVFNTMEEAAQKYDEEAKKIYEHAYTNDVNLASELSDENESGSASCSSPSD